MNYSHPSIKRDKRHSRRHIVMPPNMREEIWIEAFVAEDRLPTMLFCDSWVQACTWAQLLVDQGMVTQCMVTRKAEHYTTPQKDILLHTRTFIA